MDTVVYWVVVTPGALGTDAGWSQDVPLADQVQLGAELLVNLGGGAIVTKTLPFTITILASYINGTENIVLDSLTSYPAPGAIAILAGPQTFTAANNFTGGIQIGGVAIPAPASVPLLAGAQTFTAANNFTGGLQIGGVSIPAPADIEVLTDKGAALGYCPLNAASQVPAANLLVPLAIDTGWTANADAGDKTKVIPATATLATFQVNLNTTLAGMGDAFFAMAQKIKALETAAAAGSPLLPNA
jgi:hypothetical protein